MILAETTAISSTKISSTPSPAPSAVSTTATNTVLSITSSTPTATTTVTNQLTQAKNNTAAIAAGVTVPIVVLAIAGLGFLIWRQKKKPKPVELHVEEPIHEAEVKAVVYELKGAPDNRAVELRAGDTDLPVEIDSTMLPAELNRSGEEEETVGLDVEKSSDGGDRRG